MAGLDRVVCPFFGVVFERLTSLIYKDQKELGPLVGLVKELKKLFRTFLKIKQVLSDAEEKQFNEKAVRVRFWLKELNDAAYEADDVFDEFEYEALQQLASQGASSSSSSSNVTEQLNGKIQELIVIFHELAGECSRLQLQKEKEKSVVVSPDRITMSLSTEPQVYGRDENREQLVKQLLGSAYMTLSEFRTRGSNYRAKHPTASQGAVLDDASSSSSKDTISVFPIQGMGGLGKTTLAQLVYHDERVENHFKDRSWVCVSDDFDIERLTKAIITSISRSECIPEDVEPLQRRLQKEVHGKRLLLVLDDVWEESQEEWNKMMKCFEGVAQGSSIIVTTRLSTVASIASTLPSHCLRGLSESDCWALFKQYAFGPENEERPALVKIGKEIVKKCGGLPLAVKTLGGSLRFKSEVNEWRSIKDNPIWVLTQSRLKGILPALRLSYCHLSSELKRCFVHCSIFRKDHEIRKEELIQLWIANGLVQFRANIELEDIGNEIFNALLWRSFFQDTMKDEVGNIISCKMHDLVHDLASCIAGDEYFVEDSGSVKNITKRTRHVSCSMLESMQISSPCLRSLIGLDRRMSATSEFEFVFSDYFIRLRALNLKNSGIKVVPDCIGVMIHLRYLNLSENSITSLPKSICLLRNMQTFSLRWCDKLSSLPEHIENMRCLRHLDIQGCGSLTSMPIGIRQLTHLRTLSKFIVGKESGSGVDGLQELNNLRGELWIDGLDGVKTSWEANEAKLKSKKDLHSLVLHWALHSDSDSDSRQQQHQNVIEGLQPYVKLRELKVGGYQGVTLSPSWLTPLSVPNLVQISLSYCRCEHLGSLRKLPCLKKLELCHMESLKFIEEEVVDDASAAGGGFSSLEELSFEWMPNLEGWSSSSQAPKAKVKFPCLNLEAVFPCLNLEAVFPCLKSKSAKELERQQQQVAAVFPCLKSVTLRNCPKLEGGIPLAWSPVQDVQIEGSSCNGMVLGSLQDLPSLPSLQIDGFVELDNFPLGTLTNLTALQKLKIYNCRKLKTLPVALNSLATLTELEISNCPNLVSLAEEREGGLKNLSSLKTIVIKRCGALKCLPELVKASHVTLTIEDCPGLPSRTNKTMEQQRQAERRQQQLQYAPICDHGLREASKGPDISLLAF